MGHLKNKSELNLGAAELLHQNNYYSSVVHCAYYSCIQFIKHILLYSLKLSETDLYNEQKALSSKSFNSLGLHEYLINKISTELKNNKKDWKAFNSSIMQLKKLRVAADYEDTMIDISKGSTSISLSDGILRQLKKDF
jgi:uncharacterized protein (UPF0332 family)